MGGHGRDGGDAGAADVRPARNIDLSAVESLQRFVSYPSSGLSDAWPAVGTLLVAVDADDRLIGYLLDADAYLTELVASPDHRRGGRATTLAEAFRDVHRSGADTTNAPFMLLAHLKNDGTRACYEALGFRRDARVPNAFDDDDGLRSVLD